MLTVKPITVKSSYNYCTNQISLIMHAWLILSGTVFPLKSPRGLFKYLPLGDGRFLEGGLLEGGFLNFRPEGRIFFRIALEVCVFRQELTINDVNFSGDPPKKSLLWLKKSPQRILFCPKCKFGIFTIYLNRIWNEDMQMI